MEVLDERVGGGEEAIEALPVARSREIEGDAQLVGVEQAEEPAFPRGRDFLRKRSGPARAIALRRLDLDDGGAEIGQAARRVGRPDETADLDDGDAVEGARSLSQAGRGPGAGPGLGRAPCRARPARGRTRGAAAGGGRRCRGTSRSPRRGRWARTSPPPRGGRAGPGAAAPPPPPPPPAPPAAGEPHLHPAGEGPRIG